MGLIDVRITVSGVAGIGRRELQAVGRDAVAFAAERWWREYLPIHFTKRATRLYDYNPRQGEAGSGRAFRGSYSWMKLERMKIAGKRAIGEVKPLVWSGESRERATSNQNIQATAKNFRTYKADVIINAPSLNFVVGSRVEITATTVEEDRSLERTFARRFEGNLRRRGRTGRRTLQLKAA